MAGSFFYGYLRIYTGSVGPPPSPTGCTTTRGESWRYSPLLLPRNSEQVPGGDYGLLIVVGGVIAAISVGRRLKSGMDLAQSGAEVPRVAPAPPTAPAAPTGRHTRSQPTLTPLWNGTASEVGMPSLPFYTSEFVEKLSDNSGTAPICTPASGQNGPRSTNLLPWVPPTRSFGSPLAIYQTVSGRCILRSSGVVRAFLCRVQASRPRRLPYSLSASWIAATVAGGSSTSMTSRA